MTTEKGITMANFTSNSMNQNLTKFAILHKLLQLVDCKFAASFIAIL